MLAGRIIAHVMGGTRSGVSTLRRVPSFAWDLAIALGALALGLIQVADRPADPAFEEANALAVALVALQTLPLALRRRAPLAVLALLSAALLVHAALGYHNGIGTVTPWLALLTLAVQEPPRRSAVGFGLAAVTIVAFGVLSPRARHRDADRGRPHLPRRLAARRPPSLAAGAPARGGATARAAREAEQDLRAREAVARERTTLALELHGRAVGHGVSAMLLQAGAGRAVLEAGGSVDAAREALMGIEDAGRRAMSELDRMLGMLHGETSPAAAPAPGLGALRELARDATALGLTVDVREAGLRAGGARGARSGLPDRAGGAHEREASTVPAARRPWSSRGTRSGGDRRDSATSGNGARRRPARAARHARRAQLVGGTVAAGPEPNGWRVRARCRSNAVPIRVLLADDVPIVRSALRADPLRRRTIDVVGEAE